MLYKHILPFAMASMVMAAETPTIVQLLKATPQLSTLLGLINNQTTLLNALESLKESTIIAPDNDAFATLLNNTSPPLTSSQVADLLSYHVIPGKTILANDIKTTPAFVNSFLKDLLVTNITAGQNVEAVSNGTNALFISGLLNNSTVLAPNNIFTGGVVHIVDKVLTIPEKPADTAAAAGLTALAGALGQANLVNTVNQLGNATIFAPNNAAFAAIGSAVGSLTDAQLKDILTYHVISGTVAFSTDLTNGQTITTAEGKSVKITIQNNEVFVNSAKVITPNVITSNGVVHVIDNVINPNNTDFVAGDKPAFSGASSISGFTPFVSLASSTTAPAATGTAKTGGSSGSTTTAASGGSTSSTSSVSKAGAMPMQTGSVGAAALFGLGGAFLIAGQMV